ncbi:hypothetical protein LTR66_009729 [Elasticomyces elasticus]|nr:hypothetical protein LTR66_009729 [Elasticomyces elasticus]
MTEQGGVGYEEGDEEDGQERGGPGSDGEGGVGAGCLDGFGADEEEDPDAGAVNGGVRAENETFEQGVNAAWEGAEGCV